MVDLTLLGQEPALDPGARPVDAVTDGARLLAAARSVYRLRRRRDAVVGSKLFRDPAWDILLAALIARLEQRELSIAALTTAAAAPPTTVLRYISLLEAEGLVRRRQHRRLVTVELTAKCLEQLNRLFSAAP